MIGIIISVIAFVVALIQFGFSPPRQAILIGIALMMAIRVNDVRYLTRIAFNPETPCNSSTSNCSIVGSRIPLNCRNLIYF
jgi:hypothetical protein